MFKLTGPKLIQSHSGIQLNAIDRKDKVFFSVFISNHKRNNRVTLKIIYEVAVIEKNSTSFVSLPFSDACTSTVIT